MTRQTSEQIILFTYVKTENGYCKRFVTLCDLIAILSDKRRKAASNQKGK
ncbi:MAG: hypothetical protein NC099_03590 [Corallococcus sp.]|nr:hypothetical protein [Corallococcus sp.]